MAEQARNSTDRPFPFPLPIGLFHLDGGDAGAGGGAGDGDGSGDGGDGGQGGSGAAADRTFTQAELDRIVQERVARVKAQPPADYEDLKAKAAKLDQIEEANKTELEKAQARAQEAEETAQRTVEAANRRLVEAAIIAEATSQKAIKPEHMHRLVDTEAVTVGDDGQVTGAKEAVAAFLKANPEYVGSRSGGSADQAARGEGVDQITEAQLETMTNEEILQAEKDGRLKDLLGVG